MSGYEAVLQEVLRRLQVSASGWPENVRRAHRTAVPRSASPAIHLLDGKDAPSKSDKCAREADFTVRIIVRSDDGLKTADGFRLEAMHRLNPATEAYDRGVSVIPREIDADVEIADEDAVALDLAFDFSYPGSEWDL